MDFDDVIDELQRRPASRFDAAVVRAALRIPLPAGRRRCQSSGIELTLRKALEPWHVMGEEGSAGGTVRYVDSSVERLEVHVTGLNDSRYVVTVNGGRCRCSRPAARASSSPACAIGRGSRRRRCIRRSASHAPLTFDVVDTWMQPLDRRLPVSCRRIRAGATTTTFPVNAYEAESRRRARFFKTGHTPGRMEAGAAERSLEFPFTLDLRRRR